jgi:hypothetical protein
MTATSGLPPGTHMIDVGVSQTGGAGKYGTRDVYGGEGVSGLEEPVLCACPVDIKPDYLT